MDNMQKNILLLLLAFFSISITAQDDDKKMCNDNTDKKALKLYEKGIDKKQFKKAERLDFLVKALAIEPDFAEANNAMGLEIAGLCKLEDKPFTASIPYFLKAIRSCPKVHSEAYYYIGFENYEKAKNDTAIKYL